MRNASSSITATALIAIASGAAPADVQYVDVTAGAGLLEHQWPGEPTSPIRCDEAPRMTGGVAAGDYDGDGWTDLFVTRFEAPNRLFRNLGDGTFVDVAGSAGVDLADYSASGSWGDVDGDGDLDLYVTVMEIEEGAERNRLYLNAGDGTFVEAAVDRGVALSCVSCLHHHTSANFGDHDLDGDLDLFVQDWWFIDVQNRLLANDGTGRFSDITSTAGVEYEPNFGFASAFADLDGDGWPELLAVADFGTSRLFRNDAGTGFTDVTASAGVGTDENGMGCAVGDWDGDGDLDWFVTSIYDPDETCETEGCNWGYSGNRLYRNDGNLVFTDVTDLAGVRDGGWGWAASFLDHDNDGDLDLAMTNGIDFPCHDPDDARFNDDRLRFWSNDGAGGMTEVGAAVGFDDTRSGKGMTVLDFDRDGDLDVYVANNADMPVLYRNDGGNTNAWLQVELLGVQTNRGGIGARVEVQIEPDGPVQVRQVGGVNNFLSQNEPVAHFGLGPGVATVHRVTVHWPVSGIETVLEDVTARQRVTVIEGQGPTEVVDLELAMPGLVAGPVTRCLTVELLDEDGGLPPVTVARDVTFVDGVATTSFEASTAGYDCLVVRDPLHTLAVTRALDADGLPYDASPLTLLGGNLNDDGWIDVIDFAMFVNRFGVSYDGDGAVDGGVPCGWSPTPGGPAHADISGDGLVSPADFTFIATQFLAPAEMCGVAASTGPTDRIRVTQLERRGQAGLAVADLDGDGVVGLEDLIAFAAGARPGPSTAPPATGPPVAEWLGRGRGRSSHGGR